MKMITNKGVHIFPTFTKFSLLSEVEDGKGMH